MVDEETLFSVSMSRSDSVLLFLPDLNQPDQENTPPCPNTDTNSNYEPDITSKSNKTLRKRLRRSLFTNETGDPVNTIYGQLTEGFSVRLKTKNEEEEEEKEKMKEGLF